MVSCTVFLWIHVLTAACSSEELPRDAVLSWFRERVLEGLGLEGPPLLVQPGAGRAPRRTPRASRTTWVNSQTGPSGDTLQIIIFPSSDSPCPGSDSADFTYSFQPSLQHQDSVVTSAHFWFYAGGGAASNSSAQLSILTSAQQQLLQAAQTSSDSDGWTTFSLDLTPLDSEGPIRLQVRCPACQCHADEPDKTPFLHVHARPRGPVRAPRSAPGAIPWSPAALDLLQRPSQGGPQLSDCHRAEIQISFSELGWGNWIVHPKVLTFSYCHGNCSAGDRTRAALGMTQCCAPVPGSMRSLRITTTSDGGYSFKYETLPNIIPEECTCI
ncbi:inhibin alpha chain [Centropristis striata]|uniref:inhibin alpha chain n=1 Tax=Centropristis striata TaxID=184440 RepID=UPI0027E1BE84|nr:inhibin alpha chain [Centropristis striata]